MNKLLIKNIKGLVGILEDNNLPLIGEELKVLGRINNAWLSIDEGKISGYGCMDDMGGITDWRDLEVIDAEGKFILPCWVDSHTHIVFAQSREQEFEDRINGLSYEEIALRGGGILNSAEKVSSTSEDELYLAAWNRLQKVIRQGTGAIEIKSGYGLSVDSELKMLRVIKRLKENSPIPIKATFLGAHALPAEYKNNKEGYLTLIIDEMLPKIAEEGLADYIDAFCETNYFTPEDTEKLIKAGAKHGLQAKIHVNQFTSIGGIKTCIDNKVKSVDHLEVMNDKDFDLMKGNATIACLLPSCSLFLSIPYAPAKHLNQHNIPICLATDYNPGSTPTGNMNFVFSLACIKMKLTPEEAINAATINGAYAMDVENEVGSITMGKRANFIVTEEIPSLAFLPYSLTDDCIDSIYINGVLFK